MVYQLTMETKIVRRKHQIKFGINRYSNIGALKKALDKVPDHILFDSYDIDDEKDILTLVFIEEIKEATK